MALAEDIGAETATNQVEDERSLPPGLVVY
jgi:hypothetical protein